MTTTSGGYSYSSIQYSGYCCSRVNYHLEVQCLYTTVAGWALMQYCRSEGMVDTMTLPVIKTYKKPNHLPSHSPSWYWGICTSCHQPWATVVRISVSLVVYSCYIEKYLIISLRVQVCEWYTQWRKHPPKIDKMNTGENTIPKWLAIYAPSQQ